MAEILGPAELAALAAKWEGFRAETALEAEAKADVLAFWASHAALGAALAEAEDETSVFDGPVAHRIRLLKETLHEAAARRAASARCEALEKAAKACEHNAEGLFGPLQLAHCLDASAIRALAAAPGSSRPPGDTGDDMSEKEVCDRKDCVRPVSISFGSSSTPDVRLCEHHWKEAMGAC